MKINSICVFMPRARQYKHSTVEMELMLEIHGGTVHEQH